MKKVDYTGKRIGRLLILSEIPERENGNIIWLCQCDCGKKVRRTSAYLRGKVNVASCGCYMEEWYRNQQKDITGKRFGKLVAIEKTEKKNSGGIVWKFQCDCGNIVEKIISEVTTKKNPTMSCGCSKNWFIGNHEHGKKHYFNLEKNYVMGTNIEKIRRKDTEPMKNNTSGYQGVSFLSTRNVWVASMRFQGSLVSKTCHSLEEAINARKQMREIRDEFIAWYDSLSDEERKEAIEHYDNNQKNFKEFYKMKMQEMIQR